MGKIFKIILTSILFIGCSKQNNDPEFTKHISINYAKESEQYEIFIEKIDGCEYIVLDGTYGRSIIHKQNCKNHNYGKF